MTQPIQSGGDHAGAFPATHWSLVLAASQLDSTETRAALAQLCQAYWHPVYAFIRRRGHDPEQAKDLTQEIFAQLIENRRLETADRDRGRFRTFLLACVQHFLNNERKKERRLKRGGQRSFVSLDEAVAEQWYGVEPANSFSPEQIFERRWAMTVLDHVLEELKREFTEAGKAGQFEALEVFLSGARGVPESYAEIAQRLNLSESAARQVAHRMRCRFGELLRKQVAQTVTGPTELEAELAHFRSVLSA